MQLDEKKVLKCLLDGNYLSEEDIEKAKNSSSVNRVSALNYLISEGIISLDIVGQALAESVGYDYVDLNNTKPAKDLILKIPEEIAKKYRAFVYKKEENGDLVIATDTPNQKELEEELKKLFPNSKIIFYFALPQYVDSVLNLYEKSLKTKFNKIFKENQKVAVSILSAIFEEAINERASDIHFEPNGDFVVIRFRIDGVLRDVAKLPKEHYENVLNRIKVESGIRIDEHFMAQDGAMQGNYNNLVLDLRVSIVPTVEGEKVVLRVLSSYIQGLVLSELGLSDKHRELLEKSANKPFGMIVVTGPTGSGKTTTLYALLKILNQSDVNITTIEDPVEYKMKGINQIQVNPTTNLTFAKGLRSIVRQDPDIILVGEIRDEETAEIAVNASLTGHLLLSTFHSNDASTTIPRMLDMKIEPFLLSSTLELIIAQRLVRKICDQCKHSFSLKKEDILARNPKLEQCFQDNEYLLYEGKGCDACGGSGYSGRIAIFEIIQNTPEMQDLILKNPSSRMIYTLAREQGTKSMFEDGVEKVKNGLTTLDELMRIVEPPKIN